MGRDLTYSKILTPRSDKKDMALSKKSVSSDIPWWVRTVFYGVCSFYFEVVWTAIYDSVDNRDQRLIGYSSVWSFFVYAMSLTNIERIYFATKDRSVLLRGSAYVVNAFAVEFIFGNLLFPIGANSWDYSKQFTYHYKGMFALEYAPLWFFGGLLFEYQVVFCSNVVFVSTQDAEKEQEMSVLSEKEESTVTSSTPSTSASRLKRTSTLPNLLEENEVPTNMLQRRNTISAKLPEPLPILSSRHFTKYSTLNSSVDKFRSHASSFSEWPGIRLYSALWLSWHWIWMTLNMNLHQEFVPARLEFAEFIEMLIHWVESNPLIVKWYAFCETDTIFIW